MANVITIRSVYGKMKNYHFQPLKQENGLNYPFVKRVRYNSDGTSEMILSEAERNSPESQFFIPEDLDIEVKDGTTFDLNNPYERNKWECIKNSDLIVPSRGAKDSKGNLIIDGDKMRYGTAELYVDIPGEESEKKVSTRKLITKAWSYIEKDSTNGVLTKCKLLGKIMNNAPFSDAQDFLYQRAQSKPLEVIELYESSDTALKLMLIDGKEKGAIRKKDGLFVYGETILGATDDAVMLFFKTPANKRIVDMLKFEVYPEFAPKNRLTDFDAKEAVEAAEPEGETAVEAPKAAKEPKTPKATK